MKYKIDLHIHTNANPHAYSTFEENVAAALRKKMDVIAITNHGPALEDSPHWWSLANVCILPEYFENMRVLKGVEANIINEHGELDINPKIYNMMDIVLAGFHGMECYGDSSSIEKNTGAILKLIKSQYPDILAHLGNPMFPIDYEKIAKEAAEKNIAIELNNSSFINSRKGSEPNCLKLAELVKKHGGYLVLNSDSHFSGHIGEFGAVEKIIEQINFPQEKLLNTSVEILNKFLNLRKSLSPKEYQ
ncbi:MAG: phosphatase [Fusobacteriaceae bacterium]